MTLTKRELIGLFNAMSQIKEDLASRSITSTKVYYPISRNLKTIQDEIDPLVEVDPQKFQHEFEKERLQMVEAKCNKDEEGKPIMKEDEQGRSVYDISDELVEGLEKELADLWKDKYLNDFIEGKKAFDEILKETVEVKLLSINSENLISKLPELSVEIIDNLLGILED